MSLLFAFMIFAATPASLILRGDVDVVRGRLDAVDVAAREQDEDAAVSSSRRAS